MDTRPLLPPESGVARARRRLFVALAGITAVAFAARLGGLLGPFGEGWQHVGAFYALQARNYLRYGPAATGFAGVVNPGEAAPSEWVFYLHHPPALGWTMAACFAWLGPSAFAAKVSGVAAALVQVVVTGRLVARALSWRAGLAAAFTTAIVPAGAYFSTHGSELGPQAIALALLALLLDERARERDPQRPRVAGTATALAASALYSWLALPVAAAIALRDARARRWRRVAAIAAVAALPFALHVAQAWWVAGHASGRTLGGDLISALTNRSVGDDEWWAGVDRASTLQRLWAHARFDFTRVGLALAAGGVLVLAACRGATGRAAIPIGRAGPPLLALLVLALGYTLPFVQGVLVHRYWLIVALPLVAFLVGAAVHLLAAHRIGAWIAVALLAGMAWEGLEATLRWQARDATAWYEEVGREVRERVPPRAALITAEPFSRCLEFYAERRVLGGVGDAAIPATPEALIAELRPDVPWFVLAVPPVDRPRVAWQRVPAWLEAHAWEAARVRLARSGRELRLYDLARRADGRPYGEQR